MILLAVTIALLSVPVQAAEPAAKPRPEIQEDLRQVAKTACRAEADGPQLALLLACALNASDAQFVALQRGARPR